MQRLLCAVLLVASSSIPRADIAGTVFLDANGNGVRDPGETGIANVIVSNQDAVVTTDVKGEFRISSPGSGVIFVSTPDGYKSVGDFWRPSSASSFDFP